jgi:hypothetical protein
MHKGALLIGAEMCLYASKVPKPITISTCMSKKRFVYHCNVPAHTKKSVVKKDTYVRFEIPKANLKLLQTKPEKAQAYQHYPRAQVLDHKVKITRYEFSRHTPINLKYACHSSVCDSVYSILKQRNQ